MPAVGYGLWTSLLDCVRESAPGVTRSWFSQLSPGEMSGGILRIYARQPEHLAYLMRHARPAFVDAARRVTGRLMTLEFELARNTPELMPQPRAGGRIDPPDEDDGFSPSVLTPDYTFEALSVGPHNRLAHAAAVAVADGKGAYNPLYIYGAPGMGKTHLLQAICWRVRQKSPERSVLYVPADRFSMGFLRSSDHFRQDEFRRRFCGLSLLVLDDLHRLEDRERSQEEFFHVLNEMRGRGGIVVVSSDVPPSNLKGFPERLTSRLGSGLVAPLDAPCYEARLAILVRAVTLKYVDAPREVQEFVAARVAGSPRDLIEALLRIDALAHSTGAAVSLLIARQALGDAPRLSVGLTVILDVIRRRFGLRAEDVVGPRRPRSLAGPRQIGMYLARHMTRHSLQEIGAFFGGRDHTTVIHGVRTVARRIEGSEEFRNLIEELRLAILAGPSCESADMTEDKSGSPPARKVVAGSR
ncbi:MAG: ATP-binding protein [Phycisphaerae bacterium]|nr:MAG: AAA family ATPase [Planctomycetota bacterium]KAB2940892.1 MAG: AAA family ATPase [Phycisphaerae bacterium]MBE7456895.1 ATP-binding protein [Planctomycetia bacterium]MCK6464342.1 DnaA/Hda family protein [Phycisphaerae bacterium]MCL4717935.1 ATP-binding protein [Phycisphaerae bacterium]